MILVVIDYLCKFKFFTFFNPNLTVKSGKITHYGRFSILNLTLAYTEDAGLPYFDRAVVIANGTWLCGSALKSMGAKLCFCSCLVNIGPSYT